MNYWEIVTPWDCSILQKDLDNLHEWEPLWGMSYNPSKSNTMHINRKLKTTETDYKLKGEVLKCLDSAAYSSVEQSCAESTCQSQQDPRLCLKKPIGSIKTKIMAYQTLVCPQLEYCSTMWSPHQQYLINSLEMVQPHVARFVVQHGKCHFDTSRSKLVWTHPAKTGSPSNHIVQNKQWTSMYPTHRTIA